MNPRRKVAFVIGNDSYTIPKNRLRHSVNNARDLSEVLKTFNFSVNTLTNVNGTTFKQIVHQLGADLVDDDLVFFYYSGHSQPVNGVDYIIPIDDASFNSDLDIKSNGISFQEILNSLSSNDKHLAIVVVLDCPIRYNLVESQNTSQTQTLTGIRKLNPPRRTIIQFACDTDQVFTSPTDDNRNTFYMQSFLKHLRRPMTDIRTIVQFIENDVYDLSARKQRPVLVNTLPRDLRVLLNDTAAKACLKIEEFLSTAPLSTPEKEYFDECKEYYHLTKQTLVSVADELLSSDTFDERTIFKLGIDENCHRLDLEAFFNAFCAKLAIHRDILTIKRIQKGSAILEAEISGKFVGKDLQIKLKMIGKSFTDSMREELAKLKLFFLYMGPVESLGKIQKFRSEIKLNPAFNRTYVQGQHFWQGPLCDNLDRGGNPYYCPVGWKRWSFYVTDNFYGKFKGWSICYHGTKFSHGLAILLSGLKPAIYAEHGKGIYTSPSINYACHPRYAEVKAIEPSKNDKLFKTNGYVQFVLECRVHPKNILLKSNETLEAKITIDSNINNDVIEWLINSEGKSIIDFNDPNANIVCTGIMVRITEKHPGLLPQSLWWFHAHLCNYSKCCAISVDVETLKRRKQKGEECIIIYD